MTLIIGKEIELTPGNLTENSAVQTGVNFQEKKERLEEILFGPKDYAKDDEIVIKGMCISTIYHKVHII